MTTKPLYQVIAGLLDAVRNCEKTGNTLWRGRHIDSINWLVKNYLPSGSGIDTGTHFNSDQQTLKALRFALSFHHMNSNGYYDGWSEHEIILTASLANGFDIHVTGRDRNQIKDYLADTYSQALSQLIDWHAVYNANRESFGQLESV